MTIVFVLVFTILGFAQKKQQTTTEIDQQIWDQAVDMANQILIIDCHSHDLFKPVSIRFPKQVDTIMTKNTGINGIVQSYPIDTRKKDHPKDHVINELVQFKKISNRNIRQIEKADEFPTAAKSNKLAILLSLEYSYGLFEGKVENVKEYYDMGVRSICIRNGGKDTIYQNDGDTYKISRFANELIKKMNSCRVACDITHLPDNVRQMMIEISNAPVYVSHANIRGVVNSSFNLSDTTLYKLTSNGGVVCLTFFSEYVSEKCLAQKGKTTNPLEFPRASVEEFIDHIDYVKDKVGIDFICIGSDYGGSGRIPPKGLETIEGFPLIIYHMIKRDYSKEEIKKVMGLNFIEFLKRVEKY